MPGEVHIGSVDEAGRQELGGLARVEDEVGVVGGVDELDGVLGHEEDLEREGVGGEVGRVETHLDEGALSGVGLVRGGEEEVDVLDDADAEGGGRLEDEVVVVPVERLDPLVLVEQDLERHQLAGPSHVVDVPEGKAPMEGLDLRDDPALVEGGAASAEDVGGGVSMEDVAEPALDEGVAHVLDVEEEDVGRAVALHEQQVLRAQQLRLERPDLLSEGEAAHEVEAEEALEGVVLLELNDVGTGGEGDVGVALENDAHVEDLEAVVAVAHEQQVLGDADEHLGVLDGAGRVEGKEDGDGVEGEVLEMHAQFAGARVDLESGEEVGGHHLVLERGVVAAGEREGVAAVGSEVVEEAAREVVGGEEAGLLSAEQHEHAGPVAASLEEALVELRGERHLYIELSKPLYAGLASDALGDVSDLELEEGVDEVEEMGGGVVLLLHEGNTCRICRVSEVELSSPDNRSLAAEVLLWKWSRGVKDRKVGCHGWALEVVRDADEVGLVEMNSEVARKAINLFYLVTVVIEGRSSQ